MIRIIIYIKPGIVVFRILQNDAPTLPHLSYIFPTIPLINISDTPIHPNVPLINITDTPTSPLINISGTQLPP